jgi:hypothetical protein
MESEVKLVGKSTLGTSDQKIRQIDQESLSIVKEVSTHSTETESHGTEVSTHRGLEGVPIYSRAEYMSRASKKDE